MAVTSPYRAQFTQPLKIGQTLYLQGKVPEDATVFEINLLHGVNTIKEHEGAVIVHAKFKLDEGKVIFNALNGPEWGKEEKVSNPFKKGQPFDLRVRLYDEHFEFVANRKKLYEFKHRFNHETIDHIEVNGDVELDKQLRWGGQKFTLPFETVVPEGKLSDGQKVIVRGVPTGAKFEVDLIGANGDILFHFNPRFKEGKIVRNSQIGEQWGAEEREGPFPFHKGEEFDLVILNKAFSAQLIVNGEQIGTWAHRIPNPTEAYNRVRVDGELELTAIEYGHEEKADSSGVDVTSKIPVDQLK